MSGITTINSSSINDFGTVAFNSTGGGLFTADGRTPLRSILGGNVRAPQITNNNHVIYRTAATAANTGVVHRRDTNLPGFPLTVIAGETSSGFPDFSSISDFPSINNNIQAAFSAIPTSGQTRTVTGIRFAFNQQIITPAAFLVDAFPVVADNGSVVVRTGTTAATQNIIMYQNYNLSGAPLTLAASTNFNGLGNRPGISDDGAVVVFYGELTAAGATALHTTPGPGIFANYDEGGGVRRTVRVARRQVENFFALTGNLDGVCDQPEQTGTTAPPPAGQARCVDGELGLDAAGNPLQFASFEPNARLGVVRQDLSPLGSIEGDAFVISFVGTPNAASAAPQYFSNQLGLWTIKVNIKREGVDLREKPSRPMSVVQIGDLVGTGNQITNITVHDPIALATTDATGATRVQRPPDHRVVFSATTQAGGSILVRGTHIDSDEDGLPDHWETTGIDFNQDGTPDLELHTVLPGDASNLAANPNRKDIYVEMDFMQETTGPDPHTHQPGRRPDDSANLTIDPILQVRNAFNAAPNLNPNGSRGVTLHTFAGEAVPEVFALQFQYQTRPTGAGYDDFDDIKFGSNGAVPGMPCSNGTNHGYFGTMAERSNPMTCPNILGAKRLVFRYSIFAHRVSFPPTAPDFTSGVAEIGGNDFIVSLAVREPISPTNTTGADYEDYINNILLASYNATIPTPSPAITFDNIFADFQAGTFMHELGHTLGLLHGGQDVTNCKPNYLSVMSYSRQTNARGIASIPGIPVSASVLSNRRLDYAREPALRTLVETGLLETAGVNGPSGERTLHGRPTTGVTLISETGGSIDWNNNGSIEPGAISADVNFLPNVSSTQCANSPNDTLESSDDWGKLRFNHFEGISFADGSQRRVLLDGKDLDLVSILNIGLGNVDIDGDGVPNIIDNCVLAPNPSQSDSNSNGIGDACDPLTVTLADLSVIMAESADPVQINTPFDYVATIRNAGPNASQNVNFTNELPANLTLNSVTPSQGSCSGTNTISCALGTLNNNSTATVTIRVTPTVLGRLDNYASVVSGTNFVVDTLDPNILNNTGSASTTILDPSQTFTISGRVTDIGSAGIGGAFVRYSGASQGTAITNANGDYSFPAISGGIYTLIPYKFGFGFSPQSRTVAYISSNQVVDFIGIAATTARSTIADFDGDQKTDISVWRPSDGNWYIDRSTAGFITYTWGVSGDQIVPGDFDGDNKTDVAVFRPSNATWYILNSGDSTLNTIIWGAATDTPAVGDYDNDGKADVAVYRPTDGNWHIRRSSDGGYTNYVWGVSGDVPVTGDFDGDGQTDVAVRRPSTGEWFINRSTAGFIAVTWGVSTDRAVQADYDGDGKDDVAIWRPSTGEWIILRSSDGGYTTATWGASGDVPVPGDYDGDGKADIGVFRNGTWHINQSTSGYRTATWGTGTDIAIPGKY